MLKESLEVERMIEPRLGPEMVVCCDTTVLARDTSSFLLLLLLSQIYCTLANNACLMKPGSTIPVSLPTSGDHVGEDCQDGRASTFL